MKLNPWSLATMSTVLLMATLSYLPGELSRAGALKQQQQNAALQLDSSDLSHPLWLNIQALSPTSELTGAIELNGKLLQPLKRSGNQLNLAPYLQQGRNLLKISGQYSPPNGRVQLELLGAQTQVSQQTSGDGHLQQTLMIEVR